MVMGLTVSQPLLLVVSMTQEGFLAFCTDKVLDMPMFAQGSHDSLFNGSMAGSTDRDTHLVVTPETVKLRLDFSGFRVEFYSTRMAVEMVGMVRFPLKLERKSFINNTMALEADVLSNGSSLLSCIAFMAQGSTGIFDETHVCQRHLTAFTSKT